MSGIIPEFLVESNENLDQLDRDLVALEKEPTARDLLASMFRTIRTIKGTSRSLGFSKPAAVTHVGESLLSRLLDGQMLLARRGGEKQLNIWCAANSAGQESYSVGMFVREDFPSLPGWNLRNLASNPPGEMVARAREARYTQFEVNRGSPATFLVKYFRKQGCEWQLADDMRHTAESQVVNLAEPWPPLPLLDFILLRNVLIYFSVKTKKPVLAKVRRQLKTDGYLFLGAGTTYNLDESFERVQFERATCYRVRRS